MKFRTTLLPAISSVYHFYFIVKDYTVNVDIQFYNAHYVLVMFSQEEYGLEGEKMPTG